MATATDLEIGIVEALDHYSDGGIGVRLVFID